MIDSSLWFVNVAAWTAQSTLLIAAGALLARIGRLPAGAAALTYWRALFLACVLLPFGQSWQPLEPLDRRQDPAAEVAGGRALAAPQTPVPTRPWRADTILGAALAAGAIARG